MARFFLALLLAVPLSSLSVPAFLRREGVQRFIKAVLAVGALGYLVYLVEPSEIAAALANAHYGYFAAAVLLLPLNVLLEGAVWRRILAVVVTRPRWGSVLAALGCGYTLGLVTPARAGELAGRALYFEEGDRWAIAATVFVQRLIDMLAAVACGTAALVWALSSGTLAGNAWIGAGVAGGSITLTLLLMLVWPRRAALLLDRILPSEKAREHLAFLKRLGPARMAGAAVQALARFLVYATQFVLFAKAFSPAAPLTLLYGGVGLVFFAKHLIPSLTMMDVGIREGAAVFFMAEQLGLPRATAFNAAFFVFLCNLVLPAALGVPFLMKLRLAQTTGENGGDGEAASRAEASSQKATPPEGSSARPRREPTGAPVAES